VNGRAKTGRQGLSAPQPAAAAGQSAIKQEPPDVIDLLSDSGDEGSEPLPLRGSLYSQPNDSGQQQHLTGPLPTPEHLPMVAAAAAAPAKMTAAAAAATTGVGATGCADSSAAAATPAPQHVAPTTPTASPAAAQPGALAAGPSSAAAAAAAALAPAVLPPGLQLPDDPSPAAMEQQLTAFM
jgi:hypothetical protein